MKNSERSFDGAGDVQTNQDDLGIERTEELIRECDYYYREAA